jgi:predicted DNA-binding protein (MmcQ/YjbR family)
MQSGWQTACSLLDSRASGGDEQPDIFGSRRSRNINQRFRIGMLAWMVPAGLRCRPARRPTSRLFLYTDPVKPNDFRKIALRMQDAIEGQHMAHPDFRVNGRIFATLHPDGQQGMVKLTLDQQRDFIQQHPATFTPASGAWGRQGCTMVQLSAVDEEALGEAMTMAWQLAVSAGKAKRKRVKRI